MLAWAGAPEAPQWRVWGTRDNEMKPKTMLIIIEIKAKLETVAATKYGGKLEGAYSQAHTELLIFNVSSKVFIGNKIYKVTDKA